MQENDLLLKSLGRQLRPHLMISTEDFVQLYANHPYIVFHFPIRISFEAVDFGGVTRDCFSVFWEQAYTTIFDGSALLSPSSCVSPSKFSNVGKIISYGYLSCGFMPSLAAFPVLACVF